MFMLVFGFEVGSWKVVTWLNTVRYFGELVIVEVCDDFWIV